MVIGLAGGARRPSISQQSNEGIGSGPDGSTGLLVLVGLVLLFFVLLVLFG